MSPTFRFPQTFKAQSFTSTNSRCHHIWKIDFLLAFNKSVCWPNFKCHCWICHSVFHIECCTTYLVPLITHTISSLYYPVRVSNEDGVSIIVCSLFSAASISSLRGHLVFWSLAIFIGMDYSMMFNHHNNCIVNTVILKLFCPKWNILFRSKMQDYEASLFKWR